MNRRDTVLALVALGAASGPLAALAQQQGKVWRIGMLETSSMVPNGANLNAFRQGLRELGYVEGRNYVIEYRWAEGRNERFPELATELVRQKVDLIVTRGTPATLAAKKATTTIPVVTTATGAPLLFAASLARPAGNVTGLTSINTELEGKRVELIREIIPGFARFAYLQNMGNAAVPAAWKELERAAQSLGIQALLLDVRKLEDIGPAFDDARRQRADVLVVGLDIVIQSHGKLITELAAKHRLPAIYQARDFVENGGLISYGVNYEDSYRRAATYVDKIFKGTKPGDLPVEQPTKFELVINLNTAKALGLMIPRSVLLRADRVIE